MKRSLFFLLLWFCSVGCVAKDIKNETIPPIDLVLTKEQKLFISVKNFKVNLNHSGKKYQSTCENKVVTKIKFNASETLHLFCGQFYGGIVRLQNPDESKSKDGLVVSQDWGDEGCTKIVSSEIHISNEGRISVMVNTVNGGKFVDGSETDCKPGRNQSSYFYSKETGGFAETQ